MWHNVDALFTKIRQKVYLSNQFRFRFTRLGPKALVANFSDLTVFYSKIEATVANKNYMIVNQFHFSQSLTKLIVSFLKINECCVKYLMHFNIVKSTENRLFYFDPHDVQPCVDTITGLEDADDTFHCTYPYNMDILQLDPSIAVVSYFGFRVVALLSFR